MRTKISLIATAIFLSATFAQAQDDSKFDFGLKISPTYAWIKSDTKSSFKNDGGKIGFAYGLVANVNFAKNYALCTGVDVTYRGGKAKSVIDDSTSYASSLSLQYIEIPITLKLKTNEIGYLTYFGKFGFAPGLNIKAKDGSQSVKSSIVPFNASLIIGLGAQYSLGGKTALLLGLTYNNGFLDFVKGSTAKAETNFVALELGIMF